MEANVRRHMCVQTVIFECIHLKRYGLKNKTNQTIFTKLFSIAF